MTIRERGSLLIITLWIIVILSVLTVAVARHLSIEVRLAKYRLALEQARALARSGVYLGMLRLEEDLKEEGEGYDWLQDDWAAFAQEDLGAQASQWVVHLQTDDQDARDVDGTITVEIIDEQRKLNLNEVPGDAKDVRFQALGELLGSSDLAAKVVDYFDADDTPLEPGGLESDGTAEPPYVAKNAPVMILEELARVPGMTEEAFSALRDYVTVHYGEQGKLNINTVESAVLVALGFRQSTANSLTGCREQGVIFESPAEILSTADECVGAEAGLVENERTLLTSRFGTVSETFTVASQGSAGRPAVQFCVQAVVHRKGGDTQPVQVLAWREGSSRSGALCPAGTTL